MSDLESILASAQGGQLVPNLAQRFGLSEEQITRAIEALTPALAIGLNRAADDPQVFEKTVGALATTSRYSFFDEPAAAESDDSVALGRDLVSDLFGSPAETGQVLQAAARQSGVRADILSQLLPILASILLSGLTKSINEKGLGGLLGQLASSGALGGLLEQILGGAAPAPAPRQEAPRGGGGLLGSILGSLFGGKRTPTAGSTPSSRRADDVLDSGAGPAGLPPGLDQASIQQAIDEIKKTLQVGRNADAAGRQGGVSDLESILGQILGKR